MAVRAGLATIATIGIGVAAAVGIILAGGDEESPTVAPAGVVAEADVHPALAVHYRTAEANPDVFAAVPCFCGCDKALGHRHLLDCFVRSDGSWEAHASGCGVCLGEAAQVEDLLAAGSSTDEIRAAVVAQWEDPYSEM